MNQYLYLDCTPTVLKYLSFRGLYIYRLCPCICLFPLLCLSAHSTVSIYASHFLFLLLSYYINSTGCHNYLHYAFLTLGLPLPLPPPQETPQVKPLPGRTRISKDSDGVITGHYWDDFIPAHLRNVHKNQAEYLDNA